MASGSLTIYNRHAAQQPNINLQINQAVASREHEEEADALAKSLLRIAGGQRQIRPKTARRAADNVTIYFIVSIHFAQITI